MGKDLHLTVGIVMYVHTYDNVINITGIQYIVHTE